VTHPDRSSADTGDVGLAEALIGGIGVLRRETRRQVGRPWPLDSLSGSQLELLRLVRRQPQVSVAEAAGALGLAANSVSTLVGQLTEAGLLRRSPDPADRRVARLSLTASARRHVDAWRDRRIAAVAAAMRQLNTADRAALASAVPVLDKITQSLRATAACAR
jgi:DNA-binding MarR family transcriptional regulator